MMEEGVEAEVFVTSLKTPRGPFWVGHIRFIIEDPGCIITMDRSGKYAFRKTTKKVDPLGVDISFYRGTFKKFRPKDYLNLDYVYPSYIGKWKMDRGKYVTIDIRYAPSMLKVYSSEYIRVQYDSCILKPEDIDDPGHILKYLLKRK